MSGFFRANILREWQTVDTSTSPLMASRRRPIPR